MTNAANSIGDGSDEIGRVAIFCLSALGELLLAIPLIVQTRAVYPKARITLVIERPAVAEFARDIAVADDVLLLPGRPRRSVKGFMNNRAALAGLKADIALQTFTSHGSYGNLLVGMTAAPIRCGFSDGKFQERLTHKVPVRHGKHHVTLNLDLLRRLGHFAVKEPAERVLPAIETGAAKFPPGTAGKQFGRYALISAGSDPKMIFKRWPDRRWANLCDKLSDDGLTVVFAGHISEREAIARIMGMMRSQAANLAGETGVKDLASLIAESSVVVGTDGMLLHLAAAMAHPCVGLYGPTHPDNVGPFGQEHRVVRLALPCSPCYGLNTVGKGIDCTTYECMHHLPEEMVYRRISETIGADAILARSVS